MLRNIDISLLRTFVAVADTASMTAAANALHLTQGAISQQMKRLEEALDCTLFERDRRGVTLTDAGERLFGKAKRLLALNDEIWAEMTTPAFTGEVRLGVPYDLVGTLLPPVLKAYTQAYPQVEIALICSSSQELAEALAAGEADLAVIEEPVGRSNAECLGIERLVWVGSRGGEAYLKRPLPISIVSDTCAFRQVIFATLTDRGVPWRTMFENGNIEATSVAVRTDLAVTASLASTVAPDLEILTSESGLPELPSFAINLHLPVSGVSEIARGLARHIREGFLGRYRPTGSIASERQSTA
jgi:DNA-binding transcriptional LysR family regulator